ncbi:MAG: hypothetical protein V2A54_05360 [Bacteroidota bacterium]
MSTEIIGQSKESSQVILNRTIHSTVLFVLSFVLVYFLQNVALTIAAAIFHFDPVLYFSNVILTNKQVQNISTTIFVNSSGILADLVIGFVCFRISFFLRSSPGLLKLLFQWMGLHGYLLFLSQIALVIFFSDNYFGVIISMLGGDIYFRFTTMILAFVGIVFLGLMCTRSFLQLSNTSFYMRQIERRREFIQQVALIPWLVGSVVAFLFFLPETSLFVSAVLLVNGFTLTVTYFFAAASSNASIKLYRHPQIKNLKYQYFLILILLYVVSHFLMSKGIKF